MEHGNLGITAQDKNRLLLSGGWREEIERRLADPKYSSRNAEVEFLKEDNRILIRIRDDGDGFDFQSVSGGGHDPKAYRGRGIALARQLSFSEVNFKGNGNEVEAVIWLESYVI